MKEMLGFWLYFVLAILDFGFAAETLHKRHYMLFCVNLVFGIISVSVAAALFVSIVVL